MGDERLPLTPSLESDVRTGFAVPAREGSVDEATLVAALAALAPADNDSLASALEASATIASAESAAVLNWVDAAFSRWQSRYPLDPELAKAMLSAKPLAAAFALSDNRFFTPGAHALHQLLDTVQRGFAGWSSELGSGARQALDAVNEVIARCRRDFPSEAAVDHTLQLLLQKIQAHGAQLERLDDGLIAREEKALGETALQARVGRLVSEATRDKLFHSAISDLLAGQWLETGIQLAGRFGQNSQELTRYRQVTEQIVACCAEGAQISAQDLQTLPEDMNSILHLAGQDEEVIASALALTEFVLLRSQHGQDAGSLRRVEFDSKLVPDMNTLSEQDLLERGICPGEWYEIQRPKGAQRVRLVGDVGEHLYQLFMDFTGARALRLSTSELITLINSGEATRLDTESSFARALVEAAEQQLELQRQQEMAHNERAAQQAAEAENERESLAQQREAAGHRLLESEDRVREQLPEQVQRASNDAAKPPSADQPYDRNAILKLQIPIGTWLGFHDREPPIMAKVAVRDLDNDSYIFTNRDGIKLRELTVPQLIALIDRDMVDILERTASFRDTLAAPGAAERLSQL